MPNIVSALYRGTPLFGTTQVRATISNKALTSNLATLTTSAVHGITQVGAIVTIQGVDSTLDGVYNLHSIPSTTTFTYVKTATNIVSVAVSPVGLAIFNSSVNNGQLITNKVAQNNVATLTTGSAHSLAVGDLVSITIGDTIYDTLQAEMVAVPTTTTFSYLISTASGATTAVTQGSYGLYRALYTVPTATNTVITNVIVTNKAAAAATFSVSFDGVALATVQALAANASAYFDIRQPLATTKIITGAASAATVTLNIAGMEIS